MDKAIPEINRHIVDRMRQENRSKHKAMLRAVKPTVDNALPESMYHPIVKAKKEQMIEDKCSQIEKENRILLERMTCILAGKGQNFPQHQKGYMPPIPAFQSKKSQRSHSVRRSKAVTKSLNGNARNLESQRIANENEAFLKRLQEQNSTYNVYDWEHETKKHNKLVKNICYHAPSSMIGKQFKRKKSTKRGAEGFTSMHNEPNRQLFELYQTSLRGSAAMDQNSNNDMRLMAGPMSGEESNQKARQHAYNSAGESTEMGSTTLPEVNPSQNKQAFQQLPTDTSGQVIPRFGGGQANKRGSTGHAKDGRMRPNHQLQPIVPGTAATDGRNHDNNQLRANSTNQYNTSIGDDEISARNGPNKINIVAKKRPPPMNIGFNDSGIEMSRQVLYRNFHQINDVVYLVEISRNPKKVFILLFPNFERPDEYVKEVLTDKQATKLMAECGNIFENFIANFYVKFGKLQIRGYHGKGNVPSSTTNRTVSPGKQRMMSNIRGNDNQVAKNRSRVTQNHAYGQGVQNKTEMLRDVSSHLSTQNYLSNQNLPAVNEYQDSAQKRTMFDPLPETNRVRKSGLAQSSSKDLHANNTGQNSSQKQLQQDSERQLSFAGDGQDFQNQGDATNNFQTFMISSQYQGDGARAATLGNRKDSQHSKPGSQPAGSSPRKITQQMAVAQSQDQILPGAQNYPNSMRGEGRSVETKTDHQVAPGIYRESNAVNSSFSNTQANQVVSSGRAPSQSTATKQTDMVNSAAVSNRIQNSSPQKISSISSKQP